MAISAKNSLQKIDMEGIRTQIDHDLDDIMYCRRSSRVCRETLAYLSTSMISVAQCNQVIFLREINRSKHDYSALAINMKEKVSVIVDIGLLYKLLQICPIIVNDPCCSVYAKYC
jgi:hypothetical protein